MAMQSHYFLVCDECGVKGPSGGSCAHAEELACRQGWAVRFFYRETVGLSPVACCPGCVARDGKPRGIIDALAVNEFGPEGQVLRKPAAISVAAHQLALRRAG